MILSFTRDCIFVENYGEDCLRDVIDTTGGFKDGYIGSNVIRRTGNLFDVKSLYSDEDRVLQGIIIENSGIVMEYNLFDEFPNNVTTITTVWEVPYTPNPDFVAGPMSSFRNILRIDSAGPVFVFNKDSKGILSNQDVFTGPWVEGHFVSVQDNYTPSLLGDSVRIDPIFLP